MNTYKIDAINRAFAKLGGREFERSGECRLFMPDGQCWCGRPLASFEIEPDTTPIRQHPFEIKQDLLREYHRQVSELLKIVEPAI